jgi:hypothetical protein
MNRAIICLLSLAIGCTDSSPSPWTGATLTVAGSVIDFSSKAPIAGAQVCVYSPLTSPKACATTGADGTVSLSGVPAGTQEMISATKSGYVSLMQMGTLTAANATLRGTMPTIGAATALGTVVSVEADLTNLGHLVFITGAGNGPTPDGGMPNDTAGVTASLSPASGKGPFYANTAGVPDTSLTATTTSGFGSFLNLPPGDYDLTFSPPSGKTCTEVYAWSNGKPNGFKVRIVAGFITGVILACK